MTRRAASAPTVSPSSHAATTTTTASGRRPRPGRRARTATSDGTVSSRYVTVTIRTAPHDRASSSGRCAISRTVSTRQPGARRGRGRTAPDPRASLVVPRDRSRQFRLGGGRDEPPTDQPQERRRDRPASRHRDRRDAAEQDVDSSGVSTFPTATALGSTTIGARTSTMPPRTRNGRGPAATSPGWPARPGARRRVAPPAHGAGLADGAGDEAQPGGERVEPLQRVLDLGDLLAVAGEVAVAERLLRELEVEVRVLDEAGHVGRQRRRSRHRTRRAGGPGVGVGRGVGSAAMAVGPGAPPSVASSRSRASASVSPQTTSSARRR